MVMGSPKGTDPDQVSPLWLPLLEQAKTMTDPNFLEPEIDESDDETGYNWDCDLSYPVENGEEED